MTFNSSAAGVYFRHWPWHVPVSHRSRKRCISLRDWAESCNGKIDIGNPVVVAGGKLSTIHGYPWSMIINAKKSRRGGRHILLTFLDVAEHFF